MKSGVNRKLDSANKLFGIKFWSEGDIVGEFYQQWESAEKAMLNNFVLYNFFVSCIV